jgi:hypothetical protein
MSMDGVLDLDQVPGLGPVRRAALAEAGVCDLNGLLALKMAELAAVRGIGMWQARKIREFLRQRGFTVAEGEDSEIVVSQPRSRQQAEALAEAVSALEAQAASEAQVEAEIDALAEVLEHDGSSAVPAAPPQRIPIQTAASDEPEAAPETEADTATAESGEDGDGGDDAEDDSGAEPDDWQAQARASREQLPESALALMEAIRQAAVDRQLTRQLTRLLITTGRLVSEDEKLSDKQGKAVAEALGQVERWLQRALKSEAFSPKAQQELAAQIRKRRKQLEGLLGDA